MTLEVKNKNVVIGSVVLNQNCIKNSSKNNKLNHWYFIKTVSKTAAKIINFTVIFSQIFKQKCCAFFFKLEVS